MWALTEYLFFQALSLNPVTCFRDLSLPMHSLQKPGVKTGPSPLKGVSPIPTIRMVAPYMMNKVPLGDSVSVAKMPRMAEESLPRLQTQWCSLLAPLGFTSFLEQLDSWSIS